MDPGSHCRPGTEVALIGLAAEALSASGEEYGEDRLLACIRKNMNLEVQIILEAVLADVRAFTTGANQSDDVTAMVLRYGA